MAATAAADLPWQEEPERPRTWEYLLEGLGGVGCIAPVAGIGMALSQPFGEGDEGHEGEAAGIVSMLGAALAPGIGFSVYTVSDWLGERGSLIRAIGGASLGIPVAAGAAALCFHLRARRLSALGGAILVLGALAIPTGAVVGCNLGIEGDAEFPCFGGRFEAPGVMLTSVELPDHTVACGMKVQLAGLRF